MKPTSPTKSPSVSTPNKTLPEKAILQDQEYTIQEGTILSTLQSRYSANDIYTKIGDKVLISLNANPEVATNGIEVKLKEYCHYHKSFAVGELNAPGSKHQIHLNPNIFDLVGNCWAHIARMKEDQAIFLLGESGSGKSVSTNLITKSVVQMTKPLHKKKTKLQSQILKMNSVLEAIASCTTNSLTQSKVGKLIEFQFQKALENEQTNPLSLVGLKIQDFLFDRNKVVSSQPYYQQNQNYLHNGFGGNFKIFYYLIHGANAEEKTACQINGDFKYYKYLNPGNNSTLINQITNSIPQDAASFGQLKDELRSIGIGSKQQLEIFKFLSGLILMGNLDFIPSDKKESESCNIKNTELLIQVAELLGIDHNQLANTLCNKTVWISNEMCSIMLNVDMAMIQRDELVKTLYSLFFRWIVDMFNDKFNFKNGQVDNVLKVVEFPGFISTNNLSNNYYNTFTNSTTSAAVLGNTSKLINSGFYQFMNNYANERLLAFQYNAFFKDSLLDMYSMEGVSIHPLVGSLISQNHHAANQAVLSILSSSEGHGILEIIDYHSAKSLTSVASKISGKDQINCDHKATEHIYEVFGSPSSSASSYFFTNKKNLEKFSIKHYGGRVDYDTCNWVESNYELLSTDAIFLFRGTLDSKPTSNDFIRSMFSNRVISALTHPKHTSHIIMAIAKTSALSPAVKKPQDADNENLVKTVAGNFKERLDDLFATCHNLKPWFVVHIKPSDNPLEPYSFDSDVVKRQISQFLLVELAVSPSTLYTAHFSFIDFYEKFKSVLPVVDSNQQPIFDSKPTKASEVKQGIEKIMQKFKWTAEKNMVLGNSKVFLTESTWRALDDQLRSLESYQSQDAQNYAEKLNEEILLGNSEPNSTATSANTTPVQSRKKYVSGGDALSAYTDDDGTEYESTSSYYYAPDFVPKGPEDKPVSPNIDTSMIRKRTNGKNQDVERSPQKVLVPAIEGNVKSTKEKSKQKSSAPKRKMTKTRCCWKGISWGLTFCCPGFCLAKCCKMKRSDVQMAWREKIALNIIIFFMCCVMLFYIIGLGMIICPKRNILSAAEIADRNTVDKPYVIIYGDYYKIGDIITDHVDKSSLLNIDAFQSTVLGRDVSAMFNKINLWDSYCGALEKPPGWSNTRQEVSASDKTWTIHQDATGRNKDYFKIMDKMGLRKGKVARNSDWLKEFLKADLTNNRLLVFNGNVYDVSTYYCTSTVNCPSFLGTNIGNIISNFSSNAAYIEVTAYMNSVKRVEGAAKYNTYVKCMDFLFNVGVTDTRLEPACLFSNYILLVSSIILMLIIGVKFIAAVRVGTSRLPEAQEKFVILQVPCYTEGVESLQKTFESLAMTEYDDKKKLLFVIADGMIIGSGNDKPTPRIVLDVLGVPENLDPESKSYVSLGDGSKQHNMAKVYSGLYEVNGRRVPFVVVVKVGKPSERSRPGNRGKRDSQLILMRFLSKAHLNLEMSPLELEIYHHMKNIIGVAPSLYEFTLMVDADTEVMKESLNRMIAVMIKDSRIIGLCGETLISNEGDSWVTMMQVYEYFISHHMAKAFESLFGAVTCLPGCFCMYRIKSASSEIPYLIAPAVLKEYSQNVVDTLHLKNLLHLGEDRYLTTLMLKNFPNMKLSFTADAKCKTNVPDQWAVFLSQRRRWINSTIHNLFELLMIPQLCGFCLFSMRFVVFVDLFATLVQPAALVYVGFLVYASLQEEAIFPLFSLIMLGVIYGVQVIIIILMKEWQNLAWLLFYILAIPFWAFYLPLYAFWHMDDFSWGNTRVVLGESGKKIYEGDTEEFDVKAVVKEIKWGEYEQELNERAAKELASRMPVANPRGSVRGSAYAPSIVTSYHPTMTSVVSSQMNSSSVALMPTDAEILVELRQILSVANPMMITKRQIREQLGKKFGGINLESKKEFISDTIEQILRGQL